MNILYLHCHDAGRYIMPYGYPVAMPALQAFAENGTLFRNCHTAAPTCSPSRASMLTGTWPHEAILGLAHLGFPLADAGRHLARYLAAQGFHTALVGIQHEVHADQKEGLYQEVLKFQPIEKTGDTGRDFYFIDSSIAEAAAAFLRRPHDRPFFLSCGFFAPHRPFPKDSPHNPNTVRPPEPLADTPENRADWARYCASVEGMDHAAGIVLQALRESGRDKDTIIIFTTDHGPAFPEMKCRLTDFGTNVAFMIDYPGNPARGKAIDTMVSQLDLFPTLVDLVGLEAPAWLRGLSMRPLLEGTETSLHEEIFAEVNYHVGYEPMRSIRTSRYKLIRMIDADTAPVPANCDASPSKDFWFRSAGALEIAHPPVQLYDLLLDPLERHNRAEDPALQDVRRDLEQRLLRHMRETADPALSGSVPPPAGATVEPRGLWGV